MDIERTTHDYIELGDGITISVSSKTPDLTPAHAKVVDAIIEAVGKIEGSDKPTYDAIADTGEVICGSVNEADPKLGEPAGNPPAPLDESKPKLMISIAKTMGQGTTKRGLKVISIIFENLYEVFDRDEERAMAFVGCIGSTEFKGGEGSLHGQRPGGGRVRVVLPWCGQLRRAHQACEAVHSVGCHSGCY